MLVDVTDKLDQEYQNENGNYNDSEEDDPRVMYSSSVDFIDSDDKNGDDDTYDDSEDDQDEYDDDGGEEDESEDAGDSKPVERGMDSNHREHILVYSQVVAEEKKDDTESQEIPQNNQSVRIEPKTDMEQSSVEGDDTVEIDDETERGEQIGVSAAIVANADSSGQVADEESKEFMNEEGSGGFDYGNNKFRSNLYKNRFSLDFLEKHKIKHQKHKMIPIDDEEDGDDDEDENADENKDVNDDEMGRSDRIADASRKSDYDDDDDDDDDGEGDDASSKSGIRIRGRTKTRNRSRHEGSGGNFNDANDDDDDNFFALKRKVNGKYFRKNTNDAIKIISTPHGKVGIVYQQTDTSTSGKGSSKHLTDLQTGKAISPKSDRPSTHQKITPVLTADGKVALLYRGESENTKYEPILNITHNFNFDNKSSNSVYSSTADKDGSASSENDITNKVTDDVGDHKTDDVGSNSIREKIASGDFGVVTSTDSPEIPTNSERIPEYKNSLLPNVNRPLSEVLGIKKHQFKQFRVKDLPTTTNEPNTTPFEGGNLLPLPDSPRFDYDLGIDLGADFEERSDRINRVNRVHRVNFDTKPRLTKDTDIDLSNPTISTSEIISKTEVVNLAIIPHFDQDFERQQQPYREHETRRYHRQRHRHRHVNEDLSAVHCIMQAMMGVAAISTVFGMLGAIFKQRIIDQIRIMHW